MFCQNCGKEIDDAAQFCRHCGTSTRATQVSTPATDETRVTQEPTSSMPIVSGGNGTSTTTKPRMIRVSVVLLVTVGAAWWFYLRPGLPTCGSDEAKRLVLDLVSENVLAGLDANRSAYMSRALSLSLAMIEKGEVTSDGHVRKCSAQLQASLTPDVAKSVVTLASKAMQLEFTLVFSALSGNKSTEHDATLMKELSGASASDFRAIEAIWNASENRFSLPLTYELKMLEGQRSNFLGEISISKELDALRLAVILLSTEAHEQPAAAISKPPDDRSRALAEPATSAPPAQRVVELSLTLDPKTGSNSLGGSEAISNLAKDGIFTERASLRMDYSSYYVPKRNIEVLGARLVYFDHEHMEEYVGCCVNSGNAVVLIANSDTAHIEDFAKTNKCGVKKGESVDFPDDLWKLLTINQEMKSRLIEVSCKDNDRNKQN
jgi:hypothetical protein